MQFLRVPLAAFVTLGLTLALAGKTQAAEKKESAADNTLTKAEQEAGWKLLFNGKDHTGWICSNRQPIKAPIEDGALVPYKSGGYLIVHEDQQGDFIFKCDVKMAQPKCNSGIFFHVGDLSNPVQTGFEVQILSGEGTGYHQFGAIYDLVASSQNATRGPGEWDTVEIKCQGPHISVKVNGELVSQMDCDKFTEPGQRPDGSKHKFKMAVKDFPRTGYLGFQDHGQKCWYKNVKLLELKDKKDKE